VCTALHRSALPCVLHRSALPCVLHRSALPCALHTRLYLRILVELGGPVKRDV